MTQQPRYDLPEGYTLVWGEAVTADGLHHYGYRYFPEREGVRFLDGMDQEKCGSPSTGSPDGAHMTTLCWGDYYQRITDQKNEQARVANDLVWGYLLPDGTFRHPGCLKERTDLDALTPVTMNDFTSSELGGLFCDCLLPDCMDYEEFEEFFGNDNPGESDLDNQVEVYANATASFAQVDGYRAGLMGYAGQRGMTPTQYANWLQVLEPRAWLVGYQDALAGWKPEGEEENEDG